MSNHFKVLMSKQTVHQALHKLLPNKLKLRYLMKSFKVDRLGFSQKMRTWQKQTTHLKIMIARGEPHKPLLLQKRSKSKEGLEAGILQPLQGGSQDSGTSTPRHDVPPSTQQLAQLPAIPDSLERASQEPASRESSRSDASVVSASDMQEAPTPLQAEAVDASDK
ncbi:hypothetical protein WJX77_008844 [Trebouxia sp. C0004]